METRTSSFVRIGIRDHKFNLTSYERTRGRVLQDLYPDAPLDLIHAAIVMGKESNTRIHKYLRMMWPDTYYPLFSNLNDWEREDI